MGVGKELEKELNFFLYPLAILAAVWYNIGVKRGKTP
jgi:hypothetical protein